MFDYNNSGYVGNQIMNLKTNDNYDHFGKKLSNQKSTFLDENEEADMMNVNEFSDTEDPNPHHVNVGEIAKNKRVLKHLPITKESFLNWQKHSMLKSFATSQEVSFISRYV